jgi:hypothetical protein
VKKQFSQNSLSFFRKAADALFHPADQNEARKAEGLTE